MCFSYNRGMKITILEDEIKVSDTIQEYLFRFFQEKQMGVPSITVFNNGYDLLETYSHTHTFTFILSSAGFFPFIKTD